MLSCLGCRGLPAESVEPMDVHAIEKAWTLIPSNRSSEQAPGSRQESLDDHHESWMASDQWRNVLAHAHRAMREPERWQMRRDEAIAERWDDRVRERLREQGTWDDFSTDEYID